MSRKLNCRCALLLLIFLLFVGTKLFNSNSVVTVVFRNFTTSGLDTQSRSTNVRVLCMIMTYPDNFKTKARAVNETWGRRCNKILFIAGKRAEGLDVMVIPVKEENYNSLWSKIRPAFKLIYDLYYNDYDWFYKADDDTFAIMENLRYLLSSFKPDSPVAFGLEYVKDKITYLSGGAGYVLSREALRRYSTIAYNNSNICDSTSVTSEEDVLITRCLINTGVLLGDSRDSHGFGRFHHFSARDMIEQMNLPKWHYDRLLYVQSKLSINITIKMKVLLALTLILAVLHFSEAFKCYDKDFALDYCQGSCRNKTTTKGASRSFSTSCWPDSERTGCVEQTETDGSRTRTCFCNSDACNGASITSVALPFLVFAFVCHRFL